MKLSNILPIIHRDASVQNSPVVMLRSSQSDSVLCNPCIHLAAQWRQTNCGGMVCMWECTHTHTHRYTPIILFLKQSWTRPPLSLKTHFSLPLSASLSALLHPLSLSLTHTQSTQTSHNCEHSSSPSQRLLLCIPQTLDRAAAADGNYCKRFCSIYVISHIVWESRVTYKPWDVWDAMNCVLLTLWGTGHVQYDAQNVYIYIYVESNTFIYETAGGDYGSKII